MLSTENTENNTNNKINHVKERLSFVLKQDEMERISVKMGDDDKPYITLDAHGWNHFKLSKMLEKITKVFRFEFNINVIHGYRNGLVLKQTVMNYQSNRIVTKRGYNNNPGITFLRFAAAV